MTDKIYVVDTETTTTSFKDPEYGYKPNGHIVEIGIVQVDLKNMTYRDWARVEFADPSATGKEWVYQNTDLKPNGGFTRYKPYDRLFAADFENQWFTAFNLDFDRTMIERDLPRFAESVRWAPCIMRTADKIDEIPRKIHDTATGYRSFPSVQSTWDYIFPDDHQQEKHRALCDARQEAKILLKLIEMGIYDLGGIRYD